MAVLLLLAVPPASAAPVGEWLENYLRIDTSNPPGGEDAAAAFLAGILHRHGIAAEIIVPPGGRGSVFASLPAETAEASTLVLVHHMDVVGAGEGWERDPFGGERAGGRLHGRGAVDAKSLGVAHLAAFLRAAGVRNRRRGLVFLAVADEERGGHGGSGWLLENRPELFRGVTAVLNEGGGNRKVNDYFVFWGVEVAQKRPLWLRLRTHGAGGHGSTFNPDSAAHQLVGALARILDLPREWRVSPEARRYFAALAPLHGPAWQGALLAPEKILGPEGPTRNLPPGLRNLLVDSIQINVIRASSQVNVTAPDAEARIDVRLLPDTDEERFLEQIVAAVGEEVEVDLLLGAPKVEASGIDTPIFRLLRRVLEPQAPVVPYFSAGLTDSRFFRERGVPAYGFSPFALGPADLRGIHAANEAISIEELEKGARLMEEVVLRWVEKGAL